MSNVEDQIQAKIVGELRRALPDYVVFAVPNGGHRTKSVAARMKWTGTLRGVPDLILLGPEGDDAKTYFVEVKAPGGHLSDEQKGFMARLRRMHMHFGVVRSIEEMWDLLGFWGIQPQSAAADRVAA